MDQLPEKHIPMTYEVEKINAQWEFFYFPCRKIVLKYQ